MCEYACVCVCMSVRACLCVRVERLCLTHPPQKVETLSTSIFVEDKAFKAIAYDFYQ